MSLLTLDSLSYAFPDSTPLFSGLTCSLPAGLTGLVGANGSGKSTLLRVLAGRLAGSGGAFIVSGRISLLRQRFAPEESVAALFGCAPALDLLDRAAEGRAGVAELAGADWSLEARLEAALARVGLGEVDPRARLGRLSGGQRRRAALAAAFFDRPEIVLLDEPTNDLDTEGRACVGRLLDEHATRGVALVASHDRALLERMDRILALEGGSGVLYGGGWSAYARARSAARARAEALLERADRAVAEAEAAVAEGARKAARRARQGRAQRASGSQGKMLTDAMKDRAERRGAGAARLARRLREAAWSEQADARQSLPPEVPRRLEVAAGQGRGTLLNFSGVSFGFPGQSLMVEDFYLIVTAGERIVLTGTNGAGKTTLLRLSAGLLVPLSGRVDRGASAFLDQQADILGHAGTLAEAFARRHPGLSRNAIHAALARMGFRGEGGNADVTRLSGGERMQAALALVLAGSNPPDLLILDEPTNHLDLPALEAVEAGLAGYPGAFLLASHDTAFVERLAPTRRIALPLRG